MKSYFLFLPLLLFLLSCNSKSSVDNSTKSSADTSMAIAPVDSNQQGAPAELMPAKRVAYYSGVISKKLNIDVVLYFFGDSVEGKYKYKTQTSFLSLKGIINKESLEIKEYDPKGNNTGIFKADKVDEKSISGTWSTPDGKRSFPFILNSDNNQVSTSGDAEITSYTLVLKDQKSDCPCAEILMPKITGKLYPEKADAVNKLLSFESLSSSSEADACECREDSDMKYGITSGDYSIHYNKNMILSVQWCGETIAAYASGYCNHVNINLNTGTRINLKEQISAEGLQFISSRCMKEMKSRLKELIDDPEIEAGDKQPIKEIYASYSVSNDGNWDFSFTDTGLMLHVEPFFPHSMQCYEPSGDVTISYKELKQYCLENSVISQIQ